MFSLNVRLLNTMKHCFFISTPHRIIDINDIHFNENDLTYLLHSKGQRARYLLQSTSTHSTRSVSSQHPHPTSISTSTPTRFSAGLPLIDIYIHHHSIMQVCPFPLPQFNINTPSSSGQPSSRYLPTNIPLLIIYF